jgi:hypothetical protein
MTVAKERLTKVFKFLKQLNELRNPTPQHVSDYTGGTLWLDVWSPHPCIVVQRGDREEEEAVDDDPDAEIEPIIRIKRAGLTKCPPPPAVLNEWLTNTWSRVEADIEIHPSKNEENEQGETVTIAFEDDPKRVEALAQWRGETGHLSRKERPLVDALGFSYFHWRLPVGAALDIPRST